MFFSNGQSKNIKELKFSIPSPYTHTKSVQQENGPVSQVDTSLEILLIYRAHLETIV
jgi:hypothetical protein